MPYVQRDPDGRIIAWSDTRQPPLFEEWVEPDDPEFLAVSSTRLVVELPDPTSVEQRLNTLEQQFEDMAASAVTGALAVRMRRA